MASGFFVLLDDIAALMDDVVVMGKVATKKTAGILGDDLAVNAEKASSFTASREIPALWAITKGSFINKLIILPLAFLLSAFVPAAIPLILIGGALYLAYEGAEKLFEMVVPHQEHEEEDVPAEMTIEEVLAIEKTKVKSAIITDFILSLEIIIIALGTVIGKPILEQVLVVSFVAVVATIGVYGMIALIVRMDDAGFRLQKMSTNKAVQTLGLGLTKGLPLIIKSLGCIGTVALLLVSGGIFVHYVEFIHHLVENIPLSSMANEFISGLVIGFAVLAVVKLFKKMIGKS